MQANTKYVSYTSLVVSGGQLAGVSRHSSNVHSICTCVISGMGVMILNLDLSASMQTDTYFSNSTTSTAFSVSLVRVSIQLDTYGFQPRSVGLMYRIPARETVAGVADRKLDISNSSRMDGVNAIRSLLANVSTCASATRTADEPGTACTARSPAAARAVPGRRFRGKCLKLTRAPGRDDATA